MSTVIAVDPRFVESDSPVTVQTKRGPRVSVRLKKNFGENVIGDTCGFKPELSKLLVKNGDAVYVQLSPSAKAARDATQKPAPKP